MLKASAESPLTKAKTAPAGPDPSLKLVELTSLTASPIQEVKLLVKSAKELPTLAQYPGSRLLDKNNSQDSLHLAVAI